MGLDTSHGCWHGAYSAFMRWRRMIAQCAGFPPLDSMEGYGGNVSWDKYENDPLTKLLYHSDCDGEILAADCGPIADRLEQILKASNSSDLGGHVGDWHGATQRFIDGLRLAASQGENVDFH